MVEDKKDSNEETDVRLSDYLSLQRQLKQSEQRINELEQELASWHERVVQLEKKKISAGDLLDPVMKERMEALTYHLRAEHSKCQGLQDKLRKKEREVYIKDQELEEEKKLLAEKDEKLGKEEKLLKGEHDHRVELEEKIMLQKGVLPSSKPQSIQTIDEPSPVISEEDNQQEKSIIDESSVGEEVSPEDIITHRKQALRDLLKESEIQARKLEKGESTISLKPDESKAPPLSSDQPVMMQEKTLAQVPLSNGKQVSEQPPTKPNGDWIEDTKKIMQLLLRMGVVKSSDASLLLKCGRKELLEKAKILQEKELIVIEDTKSKNPTFRITKKLLKRMRDMKTMARDGKKPPDN
ncbi:hypothetical protein ACFLRC_00805 [Candidatus Altiarchaeota archaeon]